MKYLARPLLQLLQNLAQEVLKTQRNISIPIIVIPLKHVRHALQRDARLDEEVKAHDALAALVVGAEEQLDELRAEAVAEGDEGVGELGQGDVAAAVDVEAVKEGAPRGEEGPEAAELLEANGAAAVRVEHADHHADGLDVEGGPVAVDEGRGELLFGEVAGAILVYGPEQGQQCRVGAGRVVGRRRGRPRGGSRVVLRRGALA